MDTRDATPSVEKSTGVSKAHARRLGGPATVVAAAAALVFLTHCATPEPTGLVGEGTPVEARQQARAGQRAMIQSLAGYSMENDRRVCRAMGEQVRRQKVGQAVGEARLEVHRAVGEARALTSPGVGRPEIEWMSGQEGADGRPPRPSWSCLGLAAHRTCVRAAANSVVQRYHRAYVPTHFEAEVTAELLATFAEEFKWALSLVAVHPRAEAAIYAIEKRCEKGRSPLGNLLDKPPEARSYRLAVDAIRQRMGADQIGTCPAVAAMHERVVQTMRNAVIDRLQDIEDCRIDNWEPLGE